MLKARLKPFSSLLFRHMSSTPAITPQIAVVGAGPAGYYATQIIAKALPHATIDMYEKLPVPYGLVRYGVAPDHHEVKNCITTFTKTALSSNVNFIGNTALGRDVSLDKLESNYHAVLLTYGTEEDRLLGVEGEQLDNVIPARDLVSHYNGLPGYQDMFINLDTDTVMIVGVGNVALDVARMILTPIDKLRQTDVTEAWLEQRVSSRVKRVVLVGRRGPLEVSFTIKELRELIKLDTARPIFSKDDYDGIREHVATLDRPRKRLTELLLKTALDNQDKKTQQRWDQASMEWQLKLFRSPLRFLAGIDGTSVNSAVLGVNRSDGKGGVEPVGREEILDCGLVLRSVGFKSVRADSGLPFDERRGVVPNKNGRVEGRPGLYAAGWVGTGPRGVIIDTMNMAFKVGSVIVEDIKSLDMEEKLGRIGMGECLEMSTSWEDWIKIDMEESRRGEERGKPREKIFKIDEMLDIVRR